MGWNNRRDLFAAVRRLVLTLLAFPSSPDCSTCIQRLRRPAQVVREVQHWQWRQLTLFLYCIFSTLLPILTIVVMGVSLAVSLFHFRFLSFGFFDWSGQVIWTLRDVQLQTVFLTSSSNKLTRTFVPQTPPSPRESLGLSKSKDEIASCRQTSKELKKDE